MEGLLGYGGLWGAVFIQMRAYTKKNGKKVYGSWGNTIKIYKNIK